MQNLLSINENNGFNIRINENVNFTSFSRFIALQNIERKNLNSANDSETKRKNIFFVCIYTVD